MNSEYLKTFLTVAATKSFSRAEAELYISKQAIMHQMDLLERELGTQLLLRTNKGVQLTDAGNLLAQEARKILGLEEELFQKIYQFTNKQPCIRLVNIDYHVLLAPVTTAYRLYYPNVMIQKIYHPLTLEAKLVEDNIIDVGDTLYSPCYNDGLLRYEKLLDMPYFCIFPTEAPASRITPEALRSRPVLVDYREFGEHYASHLERLRGILPQLEVVHSPERRIETIYTALQGGKVVLTASTFARQIHEFQIAELQVDFAQECGVVYRADAAKEVLDYISLAKKVYRHNPLPLSCI
jgi:DNA-binding transcriptional LysR family regulator